MKKQKNTQHKKILFQVTGSIAAYKACSLISLLMKNNFEVQTVATASAFEFIGRSTLEGLTGKPVLSDMFNPNHAMDHINLARESDLLIVCPATANTINKLASGIADDLIGSVFLANNFKNPYWVVPAMNSEMYAHPATQNSIKQLEKWGAKVFKTNAGRLACGEEGYGKMLEPEELFKEIMEFFQ